jgi:hypothetical protein
MKPLAMPEPEDRVLWDAWMSAFHFQALAVADDLGVFALLENQTASAEELASHLKLSPLSAEPLLDVLAALGLLQLVNGWFGLTQTARTFLLPSSEFYWGPALAYFRQISVSFEAMRDALRRSRSAPRRERAESQSQDIEAAAMFTRAMHSLSFPAATGVALHGDFGGVQRLLDVGGGSGSYCIALALRYPGMRFTVMDTPEVAPTTRQFIAEYGVQQQVDVLPSDMFATSWPSGYDAHFFSNVFHDFDARACRQLASNSYAALPSRGRVYIHEVLLGETRDGPLTPASFSLAMTYFNGAGGQYTATEIGDLLRKAGFEDITTIPTYGYYWLTSATKA